MALYNAKFWATVQRITTNACMCDHCHCIAPFCTHSSSSSKVCQTCRTLIDYTSVTTPLINSSLPWGRSCQHRIITRFRQDAVQNSASLTSGASSGYELGNVMLNWKTSPSNTVSGAPSISTIQAFTLPLRMRMPAGACRFQLCQSGKGVGGRETVVLERQNEVTSGDVQMCSIVRAQ